MPRASATVIASTATGGPTNTGHVRKLAAPETAKMPSAWSEGLVVPGDGGPPRAHREAFRDDLRDVRSSA